MVGPGIWTALRACHRAAVGVHTSVWELGPQRGSAIQACGTLWTTHVRTDTTRSHRPGASCQGTHCALTPWGATWPSRYAGNASSGVSPFQRAWHMLHVSLNVAARANSPPWRRRLGRAAPAAPRAWRPCDNRRHRLTLNALLSRARVATPQITWRHQWPGLWNWRSTHAFRRFGALPWSS